MKNQKKRSKSSFFFLIPLTLFLLLIVVFLLNLETKNQIKKYTILSFPTNYSVKEYPVLDKDLFPEISAKGAIIVDRKSRVVLYEKNPDIRFAPASTTKIMTALVALENFDLDDVLTVSNDSPSYAPVVYKKNERVRFEDLLYAMLLPSSNDAAEIIAENFPGGEESFVIRMNQKAKELDLENTHFEEPVGLLDTKNYTSPRDLASLSSFAMENETFAKVVGTKDKIIYDANTSDPLLLENLNRLLGLSGIVGVKTGYTEEAGQVLVTAKTLESSFGPQSLMIVVMQSEDRFYDSEALIETLSKINFLSIHP